MIINDTQNKSIALMKYFPYSYLKMCLKQAPVFLHRFIGRLQFFGVVYFNKHLKRSYFQKLYFTLRTLFQWLLLMFSTYTFYGLYFAQPLTNAEDITVVVLWLATIVHFLISTVVLIRSQEMMIYIFSEMSKIVEHCIEVANFKLCRFFELLISIITAAMLIFIAYVVAVIGRPENFLTQIVYVNNILTSYINILVVEIVLMYIIFVNITIRSIYKRMTMANLRSEEVRCFRCIYRDLCILTIYVNENFGIVLTSCVTFSQLQCWVDMFLFIRISYESKVIGTSGVLYIVATCYHIFLTYLLCWFCEDIEDQVIEHLLSIKHKFQSVYCNRKTK